MTKNPSQNPLYQIEARFDNIPVEENERRNSSVLLGEEQEIGEIWMLSDFQENGWRNEKFSGASDDVRSTQSNSAFSRGTVTDLKAQKGDDAVIRTYKISNSHLEIYEAFFGSINDLHAVKYNHTENKSQEKKCRKKQKSTKLKHFTKFS